MFFRFRNQTNLLGKFSAFPPLSKDRRVSKEGAGWGDTSLQRTYVLPCTYTCTRVGVHPLLLLYNYSVLKRAASQNVVMLFTKTTDLSLGLSQLCVCGQKELALSQKPQHGTRKLQCKLRTSEARTVTCKTSQGNDKPEAALRLFHFQNTLKWQPALGLKNNNEMYTRCKPVPLRFPLGEATHLPVQGMPSLSFPVAK